MLEFKSLRLQNHIVFEDLTWQLDKYPLSIIRGQNLDAKVTTSNRVGKSLLPSTLTTLLTDTPPLAIKKKSSRDLVKHKAIITLNLKNLGHDYVIRQLAKGKTVKYDISIDKIAQEIKDIKQARIEIGKIVPLSSDHIFSQLYLNSYRPSVLLYGSAPTRLSYFEQIFDLRIYEQLRRAVLERLQKVNENFLQVNFLRKEQSELQPALAKNVAKKLKQVRQKHADLLAEYERAHNAAQKLTAYVTLAEQLHSDKTIKQLLKDIKHYQQQIANYKNLLQLAQKANAQAQAAHQQIQQRLKLERQLARLHYQNVGKILVKTERQIARLEKDIQDYQRYERHIERYQQVSGKYKPQKIKPVNQLEQQLTELTFQKQQQKQLHDKKHCPLCKQKLPHDIKHNYRKINQAIKHTTTLVKRAKIIAYIEKVQAKIPAKLLQFDVSHCHIKLAKLRRKLTKLQQQAEINQEFNRLTELLNSLPKPQKTGKIRNLTKYERKLESNQQQLYRAQNDAKLLNKLADMDIDTVDLKSAQKLLRVEQQQVAQLTPQLQAISEQLQKFSQQDSDYKSAYRQLAKIEQQLDSLNKSIQDKDILEALAKAYSTKGIRLLQVQALAETYINTLNKFSSYIYAEPVKFYADIAPNKFDILAERGGANSDIRYFSGAESRQFMPLSALALISLMPNHLRSNILILDELEAGIAEVDRKRFATQFIPLLQQYVPNLIVITPMLADQFYIPNAHELMLVKHHRKTHWK